MSGGLVGLLDDVAALAKLAAASIDDVGAAAGRASMKAAGVVVDDTAVTPAYVHGLAAERELPIIKRIATGSLRNKLLFILPAALLLSAVAPVLVEIVLMAGGTFLAYEGAHKILHRAEHDDEHSHHEAPAVAAGPEREEEVVRSATRTDLILSAEIMVIALKDVLDRGVVERAIILVVVALLITFVVYGTVALIVKADDVGVQLAGSERSSTARLGRSMVTGVPRLLAVLTVIGTVAMCWVGGHILIVGADELGWGWPYHALHSVEDAAASVPGIGGLTGWLANTALSAVVGFAVGALVATVVARRQHRRRPRAPHQPPERRAGRSH